MMNRNAIVARIEELSQEAETVLKSFSDGKLEQRRASGMANKIKDEADSLVSQLKALDAAKGGMAKAEHAMGWNANPAVPGGGPESLFGAPEQKSQLPSLFDMSDDELGRAQFLFDNKMNGMIEIKGKGTQNWKSQLGTKSANPVTVGGLGGGFTANLPPVMSPFAVSLPYEPVRAAAYLVNAVMPANSITWAQHVSNFAEAAATSEGNAKPDLGPGISVFQAVPQKVAGILRASWEALQDTEMYAQASLASWLPLEGMRSLTNSESLAVWGASTAGSNPLGGDFPVSYTFNGLLNTAGTLTRDATGDRPLEALRKSFADLRTGASFCEPDIVAVHPNTLSLLRGQQDTQGRYILDLISGPSNLTAFGDGGQTPSTTLDDYSVVKQGANGYAGTLWGAKIVTTTHIPEGSAFVASIRNGGGVFWTRQAPILQFDNGLSGSNWQDNTFTWRFELRCSVSVPLPTSICIVENIADA